jgi:hypothetical protein
MWTQRVSDTFTDANGTALAAHTPDLGSGWTDVDPGCVCSVNILAGGAGDNVSLNDTVLEDKQAAEIACFDRNGQPCAIILAAWDGSNLTGYRIRATAFGTFLEKFTGSGLGVAELDSSATINNGSVIRIETDGAGNLRGLVDDVEVMTAADTDYMSGKCGVQCALDLAGDNFKAYDEADDEDSSSSGPAPPRYRHVRMLMAGGRM